MIEFKTPITNKELTDFLEANHNLMVFGDTDVRKPTRSLVNEFGAEFENVVSFVERYIDNFHPYIGL